MTPARVVVLIDPQAPTARLVARGQELAEALGCPLHVRLVSDARLAQVGAGARFVVLPEGRAQAVDPAAVQAAAVARVEALCAGGCRTRWSVTVHRLPETGGLDGLASDEELLVVWAPQATRDTSLRRRRCVERWTSSPPPGPLLLLVR